MKTIRFRIIILASWLVLICIIGTQLNSITFGIQMVGIVFAILLAAVVLPQISKIPAWFILILLTSLFLTSQFLFNDLSGLPTILLMIVNVFSIFITIMLSRWLNLALNNIEQSGTETLSAENNNMSDSVNYGLGLIYREVRRARNHQRPLALLSIAIDKNSFDSSGEDTQKNILHPKKTKDVYQDLSKMLIEQLEDCTIIVQNTDHFLAALPETTPQDLAFVVKRLHQKAGEQIGVEITIGSATLPEDEYTFEGLFERATQMMITEREQKFCENGDFLSVKQ
ncbi:MAG TPA: hypothetical protein VK856_14640 [Anaerolineaceae bacterium]|nr:hypothetical protein [Anaerolineaceae bacterium]